MGFVLSLLRSRPNVELRIIKREPSTFVLFPNIEMNYQLSVKQDYTQGVEKIDTNSWEVDLVTKKTSIALNQFIQKKKEKKQIKNKQQLEREKEIQEDAKEYDLEKEEIEKQLRKIQAKISGLKNRILERGRVIEKQQFEIKQLKFRKEKMALQCGIMKQMIEHEKQEYEKFRSFDFTYVTKTYKLADVGTKRNRKKFNAIGTSTNSQGRSQGTMGTGTKGTFQTGEVNPKLQLPSPPALHLGQPAASAIPKALQNIKASEARSRRSSLMQQYMSNDNNSAQNSPKNKSTTPRMAKSHFGAAAATSGFRS